MNGWWVTLWDHALWPAQWLVVLVVALIAAVTDTRSRRIPNILTLPAFVGGLCWAAAVGGLAGMADSLAGAVLAMTPFVLLFVFAGGGAGDAKLMAAIGAWVGVIGGVFAVATVMVAGGVLSVICILARGSFRDVWANFLWIMDSMRSALLRRGESRGEYVLPSVESLHTMPYGLAILLGTFIASGGAWLWHA